MSDTAILGDAKVNTISFFTEMLIVQYGRQELQLTLINDITRLSSKTSHKRADNLDLKFREEFPGASNV